MRGDSGNRNLSPRFTNPLNHLALNVFVGANQMESLLAAVSAASDYRIMPPPKPRKKRGDKKTRTKFKKLKQPGGRSDAGLVSLTKKVCCHDGLIQFAARTAVYYLNWIVPLLALYAECSNCECCTLTRYRLGHT
jgi:hypothetical protein